jgi:hypothetical protein
MHPFDLECVAHGMTLCIGFECILHMRLENHLTIH